MHGIVFASLRDYLADRHGPEAASGVFGDGIYSLAEAYSDERFLGLLERAASVTGLEGDDLLRDFGEYAGRTTFTRLYPAFFALAGDMRSFLLTIETRIHELVRATVPNVAPPRLAVRDVGPDAIEVTYDSPRRLCAFLEGLVLGTAGYFGEEVAWSQTACMHRGDAACVYRMRFS